MSKQLYSNFIDFNEASHAWRSNKIQLKNGNFAYICGHATKNNLFCQRVPKTGRLYCWVHETNQAHK
jgi:hypothetical protein